MLPDTTPTSISHPKQETPHCSTYSIDYHEKQTPTHYTTSRTSPTDRDLVNKTHFSKAHTSKVEDSKPHTSHKPPSPIPALSGTTPTSTGHPKQETSHCSTHSTDYHEKQTPIHYLSSRTSPTDRDLVNKIHTSKVEDPKPHKKSAIFVTSHKPPSPIHALQDTTPTSIRQPKQETSHCSTHSTDYHEKQTPIHYLSSRTSPTDRDLVNKIHTSKVEDPKPHKKSAIFVTSHKPPSPIHALQYTTPTSIRQPKQETSHCSTYSIDYHGKQTSRTSLTDNDLVNKTYSPNSLNISERQFVPSVLTQSLIIPNLPTLKSTVPSVVSQNLSVPPPAISNIVPLATSQNLTLPHPPISNNPIPSVTLQLPYQATNVIPSNKSQQGHASHPFTTTSSIPPPPLASKRPDFSESGRIKHYNESLSQSPLSPNKKSLVMKEVLSPPQADNKRNDFLYTPVTKEFHSLKINVVSKECCSNPGPQRLSIPCRPPPPLGSKHPDFSESGRTKRYKKSSSQSLPSPNKESPVMKELLSPSQADSIMNEFLSTPVTKESRSTKMNAVSKERVSNPEPQKCTNPKTISPGIKPLLRADFSENSSSHVTHTPTLSPMSVTSVSREIFLSNKQYVHFSMKQNQKKSPTRQRVSQSQFQSVNQQQSVSKNALLHHPSFIKERTHHMTLRSTSKKKPSPLSLYQKGKIVIIV